MSDHQDLWEKIDGLYQRIYELNDRIRDLATERISDVDSVRHLDTRFTRMVDYEVRRSQRYNHPLALAAVYTSEETSVALPQIRGCIRGADVAGDLQSFLRFDGHAMAERGDGELHLTGVLLPETEREGGMMAVRRLREALGALIEDCHLAVFPEDSISAEGLIRVAVAA